MKRFLLICFVIGFTFAISSTAMAATWQVPTDFGTIQGAINASSSGDKIDVNDGEYDECIVIDGKDLSLFAVGNVTVKPSVQCPNHGDVGLSAALVKKKKPPG